MLLEFADFSLTQKGELYHSLYSEIKKAVEKGVIKTGEKLPSVREASVQLGISRTTVENAYTKLCIEGVAESRPQRGYFILGIPKKEEKTVSDNYSPNNILYDFSSRKIDSRAADTDLWKKLVRSVLWDSEELNSYGDPQGELGLRQALADYSYKARGVVAGAQNIVIGAGVGPLLNILCGLLGRDIKVGFENGGFAEAERIFGDYGIECKKLLSDNSGAAKESLKNSDTDILFLLPSALAKLSPTALSARRNFFSGWVAEGDRLIIEDDYNGELRYTARSVPAFQSKSPQNTVYIGSFSKLLLPSVRIAFMVLPDSLADKFKTLSRFYNQTCGKIEQLALEKYIASGAMEKHLRKLRRLYYSKSRLLCRELEKNFEQLMSMTLYESSLTVQIKVKKAFNTELFLKTAEKSGLRVASVKENSINLCFAGIPEEKISDGVKFFNKIFGNL